MPVSNAERRAVVVALLNEFDEDYATVARFVRALRAATPGVNWSAEARLWAPFIARGLSIQWWVDQVVRLSA